MFELLWEIEKGIKGQESGYVEIGYMRLEDLLEDRVLQNVCRIRYLLKLLGMSR